MALSFGEEKGYSTVGRAIWETDLEFDRPPLGIRLWLGLRFEET